MTAPPLAPQVVTIGAGKMPYPRRGRPDTFEVFSGGHRVGELWRYGKAPSVRWRAYRDGHGAAVSDFASQEAACQSVGWQVEITAMQLPYRHQISPDRVRLISRDGDVLTPTLVAADPENGQVFVTARVTSDRIQALLNEGGCSAVRRRVAQQFGAKVIGGGARGSTGDPVVLLNIPADTKVRLYA